MNDLNTQDAYEPAQDPEVLAKLESLLSERFGSEMHRINQIKPHLWTIDQPGYKLFVMVTHLLVIFDAVLFATVSDKKTELFEELLVLNAHQVRNSKLCLVQGQVHLRVICEYRQVNAEVFESCFQEFGDLFPVFHDQLSGPFYPDPQGDGGTLTPQNP